jgi:hypothetical protein
MMATRIEFVNQPNAGSPGAAIPPAAMSGLIESSAKLGRLKSIRMNQSAKAANTRGFEPVSPSFCAHRKQSIQTRNTIL